MSRPEDNRGYEAELAAFSQNQLRRYDSILVGRTPELYIKAGLDPMPLYLSQTHLKKVLKEHKLDIDQVKDLPRALSEPVLVCDSGSRLDTLVVVTDLMVENSPVIVAIRAGGMAVRNGRNVRGNFILSLYGKECQEAFRNIPPEQVIFRDKERSKSLPCAQISFLRAYSNLASGVILKQSEAIVKPRPEKYAPDAVFSLGPETAARDLAFALRFIERFTLREIAQIQAQAPSAGFIATRAEYRAGLPAPVSVLGGQKPILISGPGGKCLEYFELRQTTAGNQLAVRLLKRAHPDLRPTLIKKGLAMALKGEDDPSLKVYPAARAYFAREQAALRGLDCEELIAFKESVYGTALELLSYGSAGEEAREALSKALSMLPAMDSEALNLELTVLLERALDDAKHFQANGLMMRQAEEAFKERRSEQKDDVQEMEDAPSLGL